MHRELRRPRRVLLAAGPRGGKREEQAQEGWRGRAEQLSYRPLAVFACWAKEHSNSIEMFFSETFSLNIDQVFISIQFEPTGELFRE